MPPRQAAARRLPELRLVQGSPGDRGRLILPIAVDALGGDKAPGEIVAGARRAHEELGIPVLLVGPDDGTLGDTGELEILAANESIAMDEDPARAVRTKKDSSIVRAAEAVRDGRASAMVSAGNTGAAMASALLRMGRLTGVARPAIATPLPIAVGGTPTVLDRLRRQRRVPRRVARAVRPDGLGLRRRPATATTTRRWRCCRSARKPRRATRSSRRPAPLFEAAPGVRFVGNVEGRDLLAGGVDIVVTDGFTGNVALKALEGALLGVHGHPRLRFFRIAGDQGGRRRAPSGVAAATRRRRSGRDRRGDAARRRRRLHHQPRQLVGTGDFQCNSGLGRSRHSGSRRQGGNGRSGLELRLTARRHVIRRRASG